MSFSEKKPGQDDVFIDDIHDSASAQGAPVITIDNKQTKRHLRPRHIQLIAISGAIGTGLFVSDPRAPTVVDRKLIPLDWHRFHTIEGWSSWSLARLSHLWRPGIHRLQFHGRDGDVLANRWIIH